YHFDYNYGNLSESTLDILKLWPTDEQISQTIKYSHQLACELAEFLNIIQPIDNFLETNSLRIFISIHEEEVLANSNNQIEHEKLIFK
ncbi:15328_t:CDS:1, partial [Dentiscutata heterogama]